MSAAPRAYPSGIRALHWVTAGLIALQVALALINALVYERRPWFAEFVVQAHITMGAALFALTLLRLAWRSSVALPGPPGGTARPSRLAARGIHASLYALLLILPVTGYVKLAALGYGIALAGIVPLPVLPFDPELAALAETAHRSAALCLGLLLAAHVAAAVLHARLFGTPVLHRMWRPQKEGPARRPAQATLRPFSGFEGAWVSSRR